MSNYPLAYKLSWPVRFLKPSLGRGRGFLPAHGQFLPAADKCVRLAFVGDISAVANRRPPLCDPELAALLGGADLVVGNCESPVVRRPSARLGTRFCTHHAMTREFLSNTLEGVHIAPERLVLSLANNHVLDQGVQGYEETRAALAALGITAIGTGVEATRVAAGPLTLSLFAFTQWRNASAADFAGRVVTAEDFFAASRDGLPGAAGADLACVVPHWDWEFRHFPHADTRAWARRLSELGIGLVAGHHAHVVQPVERVGETLATYGLGDFLGTAFARQPWPGRIGAILLVDVGTDQATRGRIVGYSMVPFMRLREGEREHLIPLDKVLGRLGVKARARWAAVHGSGPSVFTD